MPRKNTKTPVRRPDKTTHPAPPLADELVASGFVPEDRREELAAYLAARQRFMMSFGQRSDVGEALDALRRTASSFSERAGHCQHEIDTFVERLRTVVLPDLEVLLKGESDRLKKIVDAVGRLDGSHVSTLDVGRIVARVDDARRAHEEVRMMLVDVRGQLGEE